MCEGQDFEIVAQSVTDENPSLEKIGNVLLHFVKGSSVVGVQVLLTDAGDEGSVVFDHSSRWRKDVGVVELFAVEIHQ